jgi:hypothetical protein
MKQDDQASVRLFSFAAGVIAGTLAAIGAQIFLTRMNVELAAAWHDLFVAWTAQFKSALAWWLVAGTALVFGYIAAAVTRFLMLHWWPLRLLRWIVGAGIVVELAAIGNGAGTATALGAGSHVGGSLLGSLFAMMFATIGAGLGARGTDGAAEA